MEWAIGIGLVVLAWVIFRPRHRCEVRKSAGPGWDVFCQRCGDVGYGATLGHARSAGHTHNRRAVIR